MITQNDTEPNGQKNAHEQQDEPVDILVIGGGVNGTGIARDAVGRGLSVILCEKGDLAQATSSASTKLFHGGLRYLEYFEFRLVREALIEREILHRAMPHISWPLRFVLPIDANLRFANDSSTFGKLLGLTMPFLKGKRPAWLTRLGLFAYDHLGGRKILPATKTLKLGQHPAGAPLRKDLVTAFEYSDCWVEDSRLVVLNARDAADRGAQIFTRTLFEQAKRVNGLWKAQVRDAHTGTSRTIWAKSLVNAGGPWVDENLHERLQQNSQDRVRLVRGSHIVTRRLFDHAQPYFFQLPDGRINFAIPYETDFTLIGTTDHDFDDDPSRAKCTDEERDYLLAAANHYFAVPVTKEDVVWTYSGVRPLYDDAASDASAATRDYVLKMNDVEGGAPLLNVFGGKITTFRKLSEEALHMLTPYFDMADEKWTATAPLPGGDFPHDHVPQLIARLRAEHGFLSARWAKRLIRAYGTIAFEMMKGTQSAADLGEDFGATLHAREVDYLMKFEWAKTAEDVIWRRTKLGLLLSKEQIARLEAYMDERSTTV